VSGYADYKQFQFDPLVCRTCMASVS